jgi:hypothetical protein
MPVLPQMDGKPSELGQFLHDEFMALKDAFKVRAAPCLYVHAVPLTPTSSQRALDWGPTHT